MLCLQLVLSLTLRLLYCICCLLQGELKATKEGIAAEVCPRLKRGDYFGEIALIADKVCLLIAVWSPEHVALSLLQFAFANRDGAAASLGCTPVRAVLQQ